MQILIQRTTIYYLVFSCVVLMTPHITFAVLPPDVLFSIGSQFVAIFSVLVFFISGILGSMTMMLRPYVQFLQRHSQIIFGILLVMFIASAIAAWQTSAYRMFSQPQVATTSTSSHQFFFDEFLLFGEYKEQPIYLSVSMNRRQKADGSYLYYSYFNGIVEGTVIKDSFTTNRTEPTSLARNYIRNITNEAFNDLTARNNYSLELAVPGGPLFVNIKNIESDFAIKNKPEFTHFYSTGQAQAQIGETKFQLQALVNSGYANDYRTAVFPDGIEEVSLETHQFNFWDSAGNFYLVDQSVVDPNAINYPSHTWLLHKTADGHMEKSFSTTIDSTQKENTTTWTVTMSEFNNATAVLSPALPVNKTGITGRTQTVVSGEITDTNGTRVVSGILYHHKQ